MKRIDTVEIPSREEAESFFSEMVELTGKAYLMKEHDQDLFYVLNEKQYEQYHAFFKLIRSN